MRNGGPGRIRTGVQGFAVLWIAALPPGLERVTFHRGQTEWGQALRNCIAGSMVVISYR